MTRLVDSKDGTRIAWHEHHSPPSRPAQARTVLLTNGIFTTENFWRHLVPALVPRYRVVHWDYRGHGSSGLAASGDYSQRALAEDLEAVIRAACPASPPLHVAFSMGVSVLFELRRGWPESMPAMVLLAGSPDGPYAHRFSRGERVARAMKRAAPVVPRLAPGLRRLLRSRMAYAGGKRLGILRSRAPREDVDQLLRAVGDMDSRAWWSILGGYVQQRGSGEMGEVDVPVLIIAATNDVLIPMKQMEDLRRRLPSARWVVVEDAGHASLVEAGEEIAAAVAEFLDEL